MDVLRQRARAIATVWLACQIVSLYGVLPTACCLIHASDRSTPAVQQENPAQPAAASDEVKCASHQPPDEQPAQESCKLQAGCCRSANGILPILSDLAILTTASTAAPDRPVLVISQPSRHPLRPVIAPDPRPPRA